MNRIESTVWPAPSLCQAWRTRKAHYRNPGFLSIENSKDLFLDDDVLITRTSNIRGWASHGVFELSSALQTIEIYTPERPSDGTLTGLIHEAVFYDPEMYVEPVRIVRNYEKVGELDEGETFTYVEWVQQIFPINGRAESLAAGKVIENYDVPDMYRRPWAQLWHKY